MEWQAVACAQLNIMASGSAIPSMAILSYIPRRTNTLHASHVLEVPFLVGLS